MGRNSKHMENQQQWAQCPNCGTEVPSHNLILHTAHCTVLPSAPPLDESIAEPLSPQLEADLSSIQLGEPLPYEDHEPPAYPSLPPADSLPSPPAYNQQSAADTAENTTTLSDAHSRGFQRVMEAAAQDSVDPPIPITTEALVPQELWHTVGNNGLFTLQANQGVRRLIEEGQLLESSTLGEAVTSLGSVPVQYLEADLAAIQQSDDFDNSTLSYGPDANGNVWEIEHQRSLNWWLQHNCQANAYQRAATPKEATAANITVSVPDGAFRLIAVHPTDGNRAIAVLHHTATTLDEAQEALAAADNWARHSLPSNPEEAYDTLANTPDALDDLVQSCVPASARSQQAPASAAQRILADRNNHTVSAEEHDDAAHDAEAAHEHDEMECPVCMEAINEADAAMRCRGTGGHRHYFHSQCLSRWASTCQGNWSAATCPVCRGGVDVHSERLSDFLNGTESAQLDETSRGTLHAMLGGLSFDSTMGWTSLSKAQVAEGVGVLAGAGVGFYQGFYGEAPGSGSWYMDGYLWDNAPTSVRTAYFGGWVGGIGARVVRYLTRSKKEDD